MYEKFVLWLQTGVDGMSARKQGRSGRSTDGLSVVVLQDDARQSQRVDVGRCVLVGAVETYVVPTLQHDILYSGDPIIRSTDHSVHKTYFRLALPFWYTLQTLLFIFYVFTVFVYIFPSEIINTKIIYSTNFRSTPNCSFKTQTFHSSDAEFPKRYLHHKRKKQYI